MLLLFRITLLMVFLILFIMDSPFCPAYGSERVTIVGVVVGFMLGSTVVLLFFSF